MNSRPTRLRPLRLIVALAVAAPAFAGCLGATDDAAGDAHAAIMAKARALAADLDSPQKASEAGYVPGGGCVPGMGIHWIHRPGQPDSIFDATFDEDRPEVVLFVPDADAPDDRSRDRFVGIEYVVVTEGTPMNATDAVPTWHGRAFDGPMEGHEPGMPWHADLHIYLAPGAESPKEFPAALDGIRCGEGATEA